MFIFLEDQKKILNVNEIRRVEMPENEEIVALFEERQIKDTDSDIIFTMCDGYKITCKGNIKDIWKMLNQTLKK